MLATCDYLPLSQGKKPDSAPTFFAIHANGIFFFEISRNVFKAPKEREKYHWRDIRELQLGRGKILFLLQPEAAGQARLKIYLEEEKAKHVFDIAETYHRHHMARVQSSATDTYSLPKTVKNEPINDVFRTFCKKVKRYTRDGAGAAQRSRKRLSLPLGEHGQGLKRSTSTKEGPEEARYTIRRLTHYTSMATVAGPGASAQALLESPVHQTLQERPGQGREEGGGLDKQYR
jgi:hypothetical protein